MRLERAGKTSIFHLALLFAAVQLIAAGSAQAEGDCPGLAGETIRWLVPSRPGGGYDAYSRLIQPFLEHRLAARVLIENHPDAGGVVGAIMLRDAAPDGRTLGIINASGLLAANAIEGHLAPDPVTDFTILGQVVRNHVVMFTGRDSGLIDLVSLLQAAQSRPIVIGVRDLGSTSFYSAPVAAELLGMDYDLVSGYVGSPARTLAVMRGEVDIVLGHFDSVQGQVQAGELIPLLQLTDLAVSGLDVPRLGGPEGIASQRAPLTGRTPQEAEQLAADLAAVVGAGRLAAGPPGLPGQISACLGTTLGAILQSEAFLLAAEQARLTIEYKSGAAAYRDLLAGARGMEQFHDLIRAAVEQARE